MSYVLSVVRETICDIVFSSLLQVPFLNLMANLQQRVGRVNIRVGGNTQETATLVPSTQDGRILEKDLKGITNPVRDVTLTCTLQFRHTSDADPPAHFHSRFYTNDAQYIRFC